MPKSLTCDSSALRDISKSGLLSHLTRLGYNLHTTSLACNSLDELTRDEVNKYVSEGSIRLFEIRESDYPRFMKMKRDNPAISFTDCSILYMAWHKQHLILTSDPVISGLARSVSIACVSYSLIFGEMAATGLLSLAEATEKYMELTTRINTLADEGVQVVHMQQIVYDYQQKQQAG